VTQNDEDGPKNPQISNKYRYEDTRKYTSTRRLAELMFWESSCVRKRLRFSGTASDTPITGHHGGTQPLRHRPREEAPLIPGRTAPRPRVVPMVLTRREHSSGRTGTESASKHEKHHGRRRRGEQEGQSESRGRQKEQKFGGLLEINTGKRPPF